MNLEKIFLVLSSCPLLIIETTSKFYKGNKPLKYVNILRSIQIGHNKLYFTHWNLLKIVNTSIDPADCHIIPQKIHNFTAEHEWSHLNKCHKNLIATIIDYSTQKLLLLTIPCRKNTPFVFVQLTTFTFQLLGLYLIP